MSIKAKIGYIIYLVFICFFINSFNATELSLAKAFPYTAYKIYYPFIYYGIIGLLMGISASIANKYQKNIISMNIAFIVFLLLMLYNSFNAWGISNWARISMFLSFYTYTTINLLRKNYSNKTN